MNSTDETTNTTKSRGWLRCALRWLGFLALGLTLLLLSVWAMAALAFDVGVSWLRMPLAVIYTVVLLAVWIMVKRRWLALSATLAGFALVLGWWLTLKPSNEGDWQPDVAALPYADINSNQVNVHNIRNCDYRTETDFDVRYYDKTFDLGKIRTVDLFMVYWGAPYMAHTMMSFGFEGGDYLCFSLETRKQKGQGYSAIRGLFRQFTFIAIASDERDVVRLRTNYRQGEEVYLYRLRGSPAQARKFFLDYARHMNRLREQPEWYNALTDNCTTGIRMQRATTDRAPWDWRMLANGYGDELLYERGVIDTNLPLAELKARGHLNARARAADPTGDFSQQIREGVPGIKP